MRLRELSEKNAASASRLVKACSYARVSVNIRRFRHRCDQKTSHPTVSTHASTFAPDNWRSRIPGRYSACMEQFTTFRHVVAIAVGLQTTAEDRIIPEIARRRPELGCRTSPQLITTWPRHLEVRRLCSFTMKSRRRNKSTINWWWWWWWWWWYAINKITNNTRLLLQVIQQRKWQLLY